MTKQVFFLPNLALLANPVFTVYKTTQSSTWLLHMLTVAAGKNLFHSLRPPSGNFFKKKFKKDFFFISSSSSISIKSQTRTRAPRLASLSSLAKIASSTSLSSTSLDSIHHYYDRGWLPGPVHELGRATGPSAVISSVTEEAFVSILIVVNLSVLLAVVATCLGILDAYIGLSWSCCFVADEFGFSCLPRAYSM